MSVHLRRTFFGCLLLAALLFAAHVAHAGTITGSIQTATGGTVANGTLNFTLSQSAILSGAASIVPSTVSCYTSNTGTVVGIPDPTIAPVLSTNTASGTLVSGTYYVKITYQGANGESAASPESVVVLGATGTVVVTAPTLQPNAATGYKVYISSTSGTETLQGSVTGWGNYSQTAALVAGVNPPNSNTSSCSIRFSDELIPTGTFYTVSLVNRNGSRIAGYPQTWCTYGGSGGTINISSGAPTGNCGTNGVYYPTPLMTTPPGGVGTQQSISGPLSLGSYGLTAGDSAVRSLNGIRFASSSQFARSDLGAQINAAIADCPSTGCIVSATGLTGSFSTTVNVGDGTKPVLLILDTGTYTYTGTGDAFTLNSNSKIIGQGDGTVIRNTGTGAVAIHVQGGAHNFQISAVKAYGNSTSGDGIFLDGTTTDVVRFAVDNVTVWSVGNGACFHAKAALIGKVSGLKCNWDASVRPKLGVWLEKARSTSSNAIDFFSPEVEQAATYAWVPRDLDDGAVYGGVIEDNGTGAALDSVFGYHFYGTHFEGNSVVFSSGADPFGYGGNPSGNNIAAIFRNTSSGTFYPIDVSFDGVWATGKFDVAGGVAVVFNNMTMPLQNAASPNFNSITVAAAALNTLIKGGTFYSSASIVNSSTTTTVDAVQYGNAPGANYVKQFGSNASIAIDSGNAVFATLQTSGLATLTSGFKAGASGATIADSRELLQSVHNCGATTTCANTANGSNRCVIGNIALSSGTPSTAVITGISPAFSSTSYFCLATNKTTQANPIKCANTSTSSITLTGPATVADSVDYMVCGN